MKLVRVTYRFEFSAPIGEILAEQDVRDYTRRRDVQGRDADGLHQGSQAFPGHMEEVWAQVPDRQAESLLDALQQFRQLSASHEHLRAAVMEVGACLPGEDGDGPAGGGARAVTSGPGGPGRGCRGRG